MSGRVGGLRSGSARLSAGVLMAALVTAGCTADGEGLASDAVSGAPADPIELPDHFGLGTPADEARVAAWDIDVRPDGTGLPAGRGTVAGGETIYMARCAGCHGITGTEGPNNRLVGTGEPWTDAPASYAVGDFWPYATTLFDYIRRAMPLDEPGALSADDTYAVIAWILNRNGILASDAVMDATTLPRVEMPARGRFVVDDRLEADVVR